MDRIELAERRFQQILPAPASCWLERHTRAQVLVWLRDDVVPVIEDYISRPLFRSCAFWPLHHLPPQSDSPERRAVAAVDEALVAAAGALARIAEAEAVSKALVERNPPAVRLVAAQVMIGGDKHPECTLKPQRFDDLSLAWGQARNIATRPWTDLVCPHDYLDPCGGLMLKARLPKGVTEGSFVVSLNPELHPVGDFVTRCLFRRIEIWQHCLEEFRRLCDPAWRQAGEPEPAVVDAEQRASRDLDARISALQALCLTGPGATLRDSCIILTQVYAAYHPAPDLSWLGLPPTLTTSGRASLRHRIPGSRTSEPVERIATAVRDLRRLDEAGPPRRAALDRAIAAGGLVLIDRPRAAYWAGRRLEADWDRHPKSWEFLRALANKARFAAAVAEADLYAEACSESTMANRLRRLKPLLPSALRGRIIPAGRRAYRLNLDHGQVSLFEAE